MKRSVCISEARLCIVTSPTTFVNNKSNCRTQNILLQSSFQRFGGQKNGKARYPEICKGMCPAQQASPCADCAGAINKPEESRASSVLQKIPLFPLTKGGVNDVNRCGRRSEMRQKDGVQPRDALSVIIRTSIAKRHEALGRTVRSDLVSPVRGGGRPLDRPYISN